MPPPLPRQFDVFANPAARVRRDYPLVVVLQSDQAETGRGRVVAPLVRRAAGPGPLAGRLVPVVAIGGEDHAVLVPRLTTLDTAAFGRATTSLESHRDAILSAIDLLIFGA